MAPVIPIPLLMFALLFLLILLNVPVAFSLFLTAIIFGFFFWGYGGLYISFQGIWSLINNWALTALPLFILMGALLERGGIVEELFQAFHKWLGRYRGSLAVIAILLGFVIGAMSGVVAAAVAALALLVYPLMLRQGYDVKLASGSVLAASTLPQLVPPSFNMIVYGAVVGISVGKLFAGGLGLGALMAALFIAYVLVWSNLNKDKVPVSEEAPPLREKISSLKYLVGPFAIIFSVLGSIFTGMATPTEASGVGAFLSMLYLLIRGKLNWGVVKEALITTTKVTSMAVWIMAGGSAFSSVFSGIGGKAMVTEFLLSLPAAHLTVLAFSVGLIFILGMFVDPVSIIMIMAPILTPAVVSLGYDPIWWGVIFTATLLTSYITPPVGLALYYFKGTVSKVRTEDIFRGVVPFVVIQLVAIALAIAFPEVIIWFVKTLAPAG